MHNELKITEIYPALKVLILDQRELIKEIMAIFFHTCGLSRAMAYGLFARPIRRRYSRFENQNRRKFIAQMIEKSTEDNRIFKKAFEALKISNFTEDEILLYEAQLKQYRDQEATLAYIKEGVEELKEMKEKVLKEKEELKEMKEKELKEKEEELKEMKEELKEMKEKELKEKEELKEMKEELKEMKEKLKEWEEKMVSNIDKQN